MTILLTTEYLQTSNRLELYLEQKDTIKMNVQQNEASFTISERLGPAGTGSLYCRA